MSVKSVFIIQLKKFFLQNGNILILGIEFGDVILSGITRHGRKDFMTDLNKLSKDTPNAQHNENEAMIFATSLFSHVVGQQKQSECFSCSGF